MTPLIKPERIHLKTRVGPETDLRRKRRMAVIADLRKHVSSSLGVTLKLSEKGMG